MLPCIPIWVCVLPAADTCQYHCRQHVHPPGHPQTSMTFDISQQLCRAGDGGLSSHHTVPAIYAGRSCSGRPIQSWQQLGKHLKL